ncbi:hypothetical protein GCM10010245_17970 [Streptomyces spectabilis]|nr:hypothetical protein GCM10010245_17970 [Streptomyces spectabilis]
MKPGNARGTLARRGPIRTREHPPGERIRSQRGWKGYDGQTGARDVRMVRRALRTAAVFTAVINLTSLIAQYQVKRERSEY